MPLTSPSLSFDPSDDFLVFDNRETVRYLSKQSGEVFVDPEVTCLHRHGSVEEPDNSGFENLTFHVRPKDLTYPAKPRDEIIRSDGTLWVVNDVKLETFGTRYRLMATKARFTFSFLTDSSSAQLTDSDGNLLYGF